ncbi:oligosaccharyl transferase delta subunit [Lactarius indigo]|nr:oligosaccharyl transferase delta subunit [Lactarius indigo]
MGPQILLSVLFCLIAAAHAGQLSLQSPKLTVIGPDGGKLRSEPISLQKRADPVDQTTDSGVQPHQTFLRFFDSTTGEEGIQPVKVTPSGKAKFELNMAKPPSSLPPSGAAPLRVSLLLGSFVHSPAALDLFDLHNESFYHPRPELAHTWGAVKPSVPHLLSPSILSFVLSLALIEGLLLWYWVELRLGHILLYGSGCCHTRPPHW